jgi:hypothetical protein
MRFSTIFVYLALAVGFAIAGPLADRDTNPSLTDTGISTQPNAEHPGEGPSHAGPKDEEAELEIVGKRAISKREDYNALDERAPTILYLCGHKGCRKPCLSYNLGLYHFKTCYWVHRYYSVYLYSHPPPPYHVYVGYYHYPRCKGAFFARSFTCLFGTV